MISQLKISLVVSVYNQVRFLELWLAAIARQTIAPLEILIADDGSNSEIGTIIALFRSKLPFPVHHIWHEDRGFRKNMILNKALAAASGNYIVLTDIDCLPHPRFIEDHAALAEKNFWVQGRRCYLSEASSGSMTGGAPVPSLRLSLTGQLSGVMKGFRFPIALVKKNFEHRGIIGCNMAIWRDDLLALNGWDEEYEGWGLGEDSDLGARLYHSGRARKLVYGRAIIYHLHHPTLSRGHMTASQARFNETLQTKKTRCARGVDQYL